MEEQSAERRSSEEGAGQGPPVEAGSGYVTVGELLELAQELGLLGACACHRVELAWPDGICLHCLVMATRRAYGRAVLGAVYKAEATAGGIDWEPGQREWFRSWLVAVQERA